METYVTLLRVFQIGHLKDFEINLSENRGKHLIVTGRNGSGKTRLLNSIKTFFSANFYAYTSNVQDYEYKMQKIKDIEEKLPGGVKETAELLEARASLSLTESILKSYGGLGIQMNKPLKYIDAEYENGSFIIAYYAATRTSQQFAVPSGMKILDLKRHKIEDDPSAVFLQHLVNLKAQRSLARDEGDHDFAIEVDNWFENFEIILRELFEDRELKLTFEYRSFRFTVMMGNGQNFDLSTLSSGYSAIIKIIGDLIIRMEAVGHRSFKVPGLVIIDEVDVHLHVSLQKKVMPLLTGVFPNIQFIVSTHSPFVITSLPNAVVYDLEMRKHMIDLSAYSYEGIIENYFELDLYSSLIKKNIARYEELSERDPSEVGDTERSELANLESQFLNVPNDAAPELKSKFLGIFLKNRGRRK